METTIKQQVALDETLVPSTKRLRIRRSNFRLPSDIQSKESILQVVYDVLRRCHFFQAFLVTADVPEIYMQEFWATATVHHHSIRFKMNNKKHIINLETFRDMLHVSILPIELTNEDIRITTAYKEYYACATGVAAPKPKASARKKRGDSDTSLTPPIATPTPITTAAPVPRITAATKGKQPAKAKSLSDLSKAARTEAEQLKIVLRRSRQKTHISQLGGSSTDKGTSSKPGVSDVLSDDSEEEISWNSFDDEDVDAQDEGDKNDESDDGSDDGNDDDNDETVKDVTESDRENEEEETRQQEEESFDLISRTPKESEDDGNDEEDQGLRLSDKEMIHEEEEAEDLYRDVNINQGRGLQVSQNIKDSHVTLTPVHPDGLQESSSVSSFVTSTLNPISVEDERMMIRKDPPLDQTGGLKDEEKEGSMNQLALHLKQLPGVQADLPRGAKDQPIVQTSQHPKWFSQPKRPPTPNRDWNKTLPTAQGNAQSWISALAKQTVLDTPIDFSNFIMNRLGVDTLTPKLLAGPTYELMRGLFNSLTKLEYHLEEVYKATTDQLDWVNPEGQQYPHNLLQPLPLIPNNRGRRVILFEHFINNDLEYLRGGASSRKYTTSVTKTKAEDYEHIKWIEDLVPRAMWIQEPINYDRHALWRVSHWGWKRQQFYEFAVNLEYALDVYSKRRIIAVTELNIVEWQTYKHLDWISVRRDDDKIYKFKEGGLKRLCLQDIEDMLLLLVQGKLSNLTVKERFAFNVSLRMFTWSIIIQQRVEDLQLGVESYQKRLNLTKPDTYRSDLKRREAYTAYSNPRGFIYQNKDKKNRLMRIDELHKFSDGTLNDVRNALDDRLKGIRMQYLPTTIWRRGDKDRAAAMIQAIDKMLKTRRILRSLEKFVGGRLYEGLFRMLQRTI
nr:hypothetical protein [Tanacetum cinerariifolium]